MNTKTTIATALLLLLAGCTTPTATTDDAAEPSQRQPPALDTPSTTPTPWSHECTIHIQAQVSTPLDGAVTAHDGWCTIKSPGTVHGVTADASWNSTLVPQGLRFQVYRGDRVVHEDTAQATNGSATLDFGALRRGSYEVRVYAERGAVDATTRLHLHGDLQPENLP